MLAEVEMPRHGGQVRLARGVASEKFDGARDALVVPRAGPADGDIF
jgi:hypothetical protein